MIRDIIQIGDTKIQRHIDNKRPITEREDEFIKEMTLNEHRLMQGKISFLFLN
jgi:hypothetical protein